MRTTLALTDDVTRNENATAESQRGDCKRGEYSLSKFHPITPRRVQLEILQHCELPFYNAMRFNSQKCAQPLLLSLEFQVVLPISQLLEYLEH